MTALVIPLATLRLCRGFCCKAAHLSINRMESGDIQRGKGGASIWEGPVPRSWGTGNLRLPYWVPQWGGGGWLGMLSFPGGIGRGNVLGVSVAVPWSRCDLCVQFNLEPVNRVWVKKQFYEAGLEGLFWSISSQVIYPSFLSNTIA